MSSSGEIWVWILVILQPIQSECNHITKSQCWYNAHMTTIVFMGSPDFSLPTLRALSRAYDLVGVVTQPAAFGQILRKDVLDLPRFGCINVHASLLPRWRGAAPINAAILHGDEETGVTIMVMDVGLDTGPMLSKRSIRLTRDETAGSAFEKMSQLGAGLLTETLPNYLSGKLTPTPQPEDGVTYAPMIKKEEGRLDFSQNAEALERRVRAFNPWPGAFMDFDGTLLKIHRARVEGGLAETGQRLVVHDQPAVGAGGGLLVLEEVQPAGKKPMSGKSFLAGARQWADHLSRE